MTRRDPDRYLMRSASAVIAFWVGAVVLLVVVGIPLVQADWRLFWFLLPPSLFLAWLFWIVLYRPAVYYDKARAIIVNVGRRHILPWGHVTSVRQGISMTFDLDAGKSVQAWGMPAPRRRGIIAGAVDRRTRPTEDLHHDAEILDGTRLAATPASEPVRTEWDVVPLVLGAVVVLAVVIEVAIGV